LSHYFPQTAVTMKVVWESFGDETNPLLKREHDVKAVAKRTRVTINGYTEADTFELELDYKVFPFDPRCIRSCQVGIYLQDMKKQFDDRGQAVEIQPSEENAVFLGFADKEEMQFDQESRTVRMKGRDLTSIFIDQTWPGLSLDLTKPLNLVVAEILDTLKATGDIKVDNRVGGVLPTLASFYPDFGALSGKRNARAKENYWDVIQDIVGKAGLIAYMELDKLVLTKPRTLYSREQAIQFIYGSNVKEMTMERNLGSQKGFNVRVRSISGKTILKADIPKDAVKLPGSGREVKRVKQLANGSAQEETAPYFTFNVANVQDKSHLIEIGEGIFEELGRQQIEGRLTTYEMQSTQVAGSCFDLTKIRNGTPIMLEIGIDDLNQIQQKASQADRFKYLIRKCYPTQVATIFAATMGKFSTPFYTRSVEFSCDAESGFQIDLDFVNFIETSGKGLGI